MELPVYDGDRTAVKAGLVDIKLGSGTELGVEHTGGLVTVGWLACRTPDVETVGCVVWLDPTPAGHAWQ